MKNIDIDPLAVRRVAANLKSYSNELKQSQRELDNIITGVEDAWKSRNTSAYINCLEDTGRELRTAVNSVDTIAANLINIAGTVERTERELQQLMNNSGGGGGGASGGR